MLFLGCSTLVIIMRKLTNKIEILDNEQLFKLIDPNTEIVIIAPWNGQPIPITIKMLDSVVMSSCGEFNLVSSVIADNNKEEPTQEDMIKTKNIHENMLKLALVHPTFAELEEHLIEKDFYAIRTAEVKEIKELIEQVQSEEDRAPLIARLDMLELSIAFILPEDFTLFVVTILLQQEATDLNKLTKDTLLKAGFLAEKYNVRPSEYLTGIFTEKQKVDIDITALTLVNDYREDQQIEKSGMKWIRGNNGK